MASGEALDAMPRYSRARRTPMGFGRPANARFLPTYTYSSCHRYTASKGRIVSRVGNTMVIIAYSRDMFLLTHMLEESRLSAHAVQVILLLNSLERLAVQEPCKHVLS